MPRIRKHTAFLDISGFTSREKPEKGPHRLQFERSGSYMATFGAEAREKLINRLQRMEGQVRGVCRMIEEERDCQDVLTQLAAIRGAAYQASIFAVREYAVNCLKTPEAQISPDETIARMINTLQQLPY